MEWYLLSKIFILLIACGIAAYTDYKTGYIYDWISLPLIILGLASLVLESFFLKTPLGFTYFLKIIAISVAIYVIGYAMYYFGKLGGGDIKLFIGINLMLPYFNNNLTILWLLVLSSLLSVLIVSIKYLIILSNKIKKKELNKIIKSRKSNILRSVLMFILFFILVFYSVKSMVFSFWLFFLLIPIVLGLLAMIFEPEIKKYIYLKRRKLSELEDGDVLAVEHLSKEELEKLKLKNRLVLEHNDIERIKKSKEFKSLPIYYNLPRFGPYIFLGLLVFLIIGNFPII